MQQIRNLKILKLKKKNKNHKMNNKEVKIL